MSGSSSDSRESSSGSEGETQRTDVTQDNTVDDSGPVGGDAVESLSSSEYESGSRVLLNSDPSASKKDKKKGKNKKTEYLRLDDSDSESSSGSLYSDEAEFGGDPETAYGEAKGKAKEMAGANPKAKGKAKAKAKRLLMEQIVDVSSSSDDDSDSDFSLVELADNGAVTAPVSITLDTEGLSEEQKKVLDDIKEILENNLWYWKQYPIILPPTIFVDSNEGPGDVSVNQNISTLKNLVDLRTGMFKSVPMQYNLAADGPGQVSSLNSAQFAELRKTGKLSVPSTQFPEINNVWKLSELLLRGTDPIFHTFQKRLSTAMIQIRRIPNRFYKGHVNVVSGAKNCLKFFLDIANIFFGLPTWSRPHKKSVDALFWRRLQWILAPFGSSAEDLRAELQVKAKKAEKLKKKKGADLKEDRQIREKRKYALEDIEFKWGELIGVVVNDDVDQEEHLEGLKLELRELGTNEGIVSQIFSKVDNNWKIAKIKFAKDALADIIKANGGESTDEDLEKVEELCNEERIRRVIDALKSATINNEKRYKGLGLFLARFFEALYEVRKITSRMMNEERLKQKDIEELYEKTCPVSSKHSSWFRHRVEQGLEKWREDPERTVGIWKELSEELRDKGLHLESYLVDKSFQWFQTKEKDSLDFLWDIKTPRREWQWKKKILLPSNYKIIQNKPGILPKYYLEKYVYVKAKSSTPGWRWLILLSRLRCWWKNSMVLLISNLVAGPLSLRALVTPRPYYPAKTVDQNTGQLIPDRHPKIKTFPSRVASVWKSVNKSRNNFESQPDTGFIGKSVSRIFNVIWNYVFKGFLVTLILFMVMPAAIVINTIISVILCLTSVLWAPVVVWFSFLFTIFIYDNNGTRKYNYRGFPFLMSWVRLLGFGIGQIILSFLAAFIIHPVIAFVVALVASVQWFARSCYDFFVFWLIVRWRGRVPASDSFLARRIAGPGIGQTYYITCQPEEALVLLQLQLELEELDLFENHTKAKISEPGSLYRDFVRKMFSNFGKMSPDYPYEQDTNFLRNKLNKLISERKKAVSQGSTSFMMGRMRQPEAELAETLQQGQVMIKHFVRTRILPYYTDRQQYWTNNGVLQKDWNQLTHKYFTGLFGDGFLTPLLESDTSVQLEVQGTVNLKGFADMIKRDKIRDDLDLAVHRLINNSKVHNVLPSIDASDVYLLSSYQFQHQLADRLTCSFFAGNIGKDILLHSAQLKYHIKQGVLDPIELNESSDEED